jgi:hypothetical protein
MRPILQIWQDFSGYLCFALGSLKVRLRSSQNILYTNQEKLKEKLTKLQKINMKISEGFLPSLSRLFAVIIPA